MDLQASKAQRSARFEHQRRLAAGEILRLGAWPGELSVVDGRVWLTRPGDLDDHWLRRGDAIVLGRDRAVIVEAAGSAATLRWMPDPVAGPLETVLRRTLRALAAASRSAAAALDSAGRRLDAAARPHNALLPAAAADPCPTPCA